MGKKKIVLDKKSIFKGKILLDVHLDKVMLPNGTAVRLECIKHPGAAAVIPFLSKNEIITSSGRLQDVLITSYLAYVNSLSRILQSLNIEKRVRERDETLEKYLSTKEKK